MDSPFVIIGTLTVIIVLATFVLSDLWDRMDRARKIVTVFPKGTVVKFDGVPCRLLQDTPYYSKTFQPKEES